VEQATGKSKNRPAFATGKSARLKYETISTEKRLVEFCRDLTQWDSVALDTEFVSERTYRPQLCLVQLAAPDRTPVIIDTVQVEDITILWETLAENPILTLVHAGQCELEFSLRTIDRFPSRFFDIQIGAGFVGADYPAGYANLVNRFLGIRMKKDETRSDWRKRPLSKQQVGYALADVKYLHRISGMLIDQIEKTGRREWVEDEHRRLTRQVTRLSSDDRWQRLGGARRLKPKAQGALRELWRWRENEAQRRNQPVRWVMRDDLLVELARRGVTDEREILSVRGLDRADIKRRVHELSECIRRGHENIPEQLAADKSKPTTVAKPDAALVQLLYAVMGDTCRKANVAPSLLATTDDIRSFILYRTGQAGKDAEPPRLAQGWRGELVGGLLTELLEGKKSIRITNPSGEYPLEVEHRETE